MSLSPYFYVEKWNNEKNCYEEINLYKKAGEYASKEEKACGFEKVDFWPWNGTHEIFSLLGTSSRSDTYDAIAGVHYGEPPMVSAGVKGEIDEFFTEDSYEKADSTIRWITLADLYIEKLTNPTVVDFDADWNDEDIERAPRKENPINTVINRINTFVSLGTDDDWEIENDKSLIRLVYWVVW